MYRIKIHERRMVRCIKLTNLLGVDPLYLWSGWFTSSKRLLWLRLDASYVSVGR